MACYIHDVRTGVRKRRKISEGRWKRVRGKVERAHGE